MCRSISCHLLYLSFKLYAELAEIKKGEADTVHHFDADTYANTYSFDAALTAAGGLIELTKKVVSGKLDNGFAIIRPPGITFVFDLAHFR